MARRIWVVEAMFPERPGVWEAPGSDLDLFLLKADAMRGAGELRTEFNEGMKFRVTKYVPAPVPDTTVEPDDVPPFI